MRSRIIPNCHNRVFRDLTLRFNPNTLLICSKKQSSNHKIKSDRTMVAHQALNCIIESYIYVSRDYILPWAAISAHNRHFARDMLQDSKIWNWVKSCSIFVQLHTFNLHDVKNVTFKFEEFHCLHLSIWDWWNLPTTFELDECHSSQSSGYDQLL